MRKRFRIPTVYKRGIWYCFRITDSHGKRLVIKSVTRQEAQIRLLDMNKQVMSNITGSCSYKITVDQAISLWLTLKKGRIDDSSYQRYENYMSNFQTFLQKRRPGVQHLNDVQTEHISDFMDYRLGEGRSTKTVNLERDALHNLFCMLIDAKKISDFNPVAKTKRFKVIKVQKRRCLSDEELFKFFEKAKEEKGTVNWYAIFWTTYIGGFRRDEVRKLEKENVDLKNDSIKLLDTKTDNPRTVPIHPQLKPVLQQAVQVSKSKVVFPNAKGDLLPRNAMRTKMMQICNKAGIAHATVHDFRHTFASRVGCSEDTKQRIGGWSNKQVLRDTYMHPQEKHIQEDYFKTNFMPTP